MKVVEKILEYVSVLLMVVLTAVITLQVFSRMFNKPVFWSEEFSRVSLVYLTYVAGALAYSKGKGLRITMFIDKFPPLIRKYINLFTAVLSFVVMLMVVYSSIMLSSQLWNITTTALKWQKGIIVLVIPVAFGLLAIKWLQNIKAVLQGNASGE